MQVYVMCIELYRTTAMVTTNAIFEHLKSHVNIFRAQAVHLLRAAFPCSRRTATHARRANNYRRYYSNIHSSVLICLLVVVSRVTEKSARAVHGIRGNRQNEDAIKCSANCKFVLINMYVGALTYSVEHAT